jgi:seryl-tRNA synthetase
MLQLGFIRQNPDLVKERLKIKNFDGAFLIDELIRLDIKVRNLQTEKEEIQGRIKALSKITGGLMQEGKLQEAELKKAEVAKYKIQMEDVAELDRARAALEEILYQIPNLPSEKVPPGKTPDDNELIRQSGLRSPLPPGALPHWDLTKKYDLIDFELGNKITGSGFPLYKSRGAKLQRALIQYFLDFNTQAGYTEYSPPLMVNQASAFGTGQLPDKEGQMYYVNEDQFYLIPTAEVPLTNIYRETIVKENELPIKMTGYTPCFRREAGSYGKDVRGLNRLHQFDKVEIVQLVHPDRSYEVLEEMMLHVEKLLQSLGLHYRILRLCGGDMSFASALTYDFEVFSAAQEKWLEVSSVSNFETFQTNRMKARFKDAAGKNQLLHSLNGSSLALPRILASLLENNQTKDSILLPEVLHDYFGANSISGLQ